MTLLTHGSSQIGCGLMVLGDNAGIFPTSVYSSVDWVLRQYHLPHADIQ